ncbi:serine hydrolase domain-containing protein [Granulosicoccus sp. 3-233]|uniref:serine hydrolase domain-containing protein n=1 Tax=Granulosicoccus sp. 3-233 TaxID=3417969 RepID=UPI003D359783
MRPDTGGISEGAFKRAVSLLDEQIDAGRIPGAVLGTVDIGGQRRLYSRGLAQVSPERRAMQDDTWFDLASLTKVIFTAPRILQLLRDEAIDLDEPLTRLLPDLRQYDNDAWERKVSFAQCLGHQSAFPAVEPIYTYGRDAELLRAFVLQREWRQRSAPPVYSDINFILLGLALERYHGVRIRSMPAGPGFAFEAPAEHCAATEFCTWRQRLICGEVHDDNCNALQGAGHAGLFGTAGAVLDHAQGLLQGTAASPAVIDAMRTPVSDTRTLGWERAHTGWSGGKFCSAGTIGHTGFTGTGLWIDFDAGCAWTLLSNRIHPTRHADSGIVSLRRDVSDALTATGDL